MARDDAAIAQLRESAAACRDCPLWENATQVVFGEGPANAPLMLVGEQPGDKEDVAGQPFVGPAGLLLDRALHDAGIDRASAYVTNAVKHFKFVLRGKRRLHQKPTVVEINACRQWLEREIEAVRPATIIALGATAARSVFGREMKIGVNRGRIIALPSALTPAHTPALSGLITVHPSSLLRIPDEDARALGYQRFVADLAFARASLPPASRR
jgi:uracil-DNA glycosylase